jgi:hypothetical protein
MAGANLSESSGRALDTAIFQACPCSAGSNSCNRCSVISTNAFEGCGRSGCMSNASVRSEPTQNMTRATRSRFRIARISSNVAGPAKSAPRSVNCCRNSWHLPASAKSKAASSLPARRSALRRCHRASPAPPPGRAKRASTRRLVLPARRYRFFARRAAAAPQSLAGSYRAPRQSA